jgi:hypothetical protein
MNRFMRSKKSSGFVTLVTVLTEFSRQVCRTKEAITRLANENWYFHLLTNCSKPAAKAYCQTCGEI